MFAFLKRSDEPERLTPREIVVRAQAGEIQIIDVRDPAELRATGMAEGAISIPLAVLEFRTDPRHPDFHPELSPDVPVALYCASGGRSAMGVRVLQRNGFAEVHNLGGLGHWAQAGGKVARAGKATGR